MRLLVTRPEPDGESTAEKLRANGHEVLLAPLLRIESVDAKIGKGPWGAAVMTSANAVRAVRLHPQLAKLLDLTVFAVGVRTASDALDAGFAAVLSADGDQKDLARFLAKRYRGDAPLLYLAGEDRAGDVAGDLAKAGISVETVVVYRAVKVDTFPKAVRDALAAGKIDGVLHFSRRSAESYLACARVGGILEKALAPLHYCLSKAVAEPLVAAGAARTRVAKRPHEAALLGLVGALAKSK